MEDGEVERMNLKIIGVLCILASCGGCGFMLASQYMVKIRTLRNLIAALEYMECELQYRGTPLPQLCRQAGQRSQGIVQKMFGNLAEELDTQISPNPERCMAAVLDRLGGIDGTFAEVAQQLGMNLGRFDVSGQLRGLESIRILCSKKLEMLAQNKESRLRSYQTLGLCAGAALAILLV